ncbi:helix-turn-helix transcriptional regulator [Pseudorhodoferax soli]|uniref:AraC family transcriptional regulator n=1 Tax=Pseudorhodoferax soli TaxID=545864 RepID=A0A368XLW7_9BURK|nr:AraC family transcriptional regulator [Pseudorhodoferax soli]RCW68549.1 AraC family transcriptional regulator [Pseudorhodoferax soli]
MHKRPASYQDNIHSCEVHRTDVQGTVHSLEAARWQGLPIAMAQTDESITVEAGYVPCSAVSVFLGGHGSWLARSGVSSWGGAIHAGQACVLPRHTEIDTGIINGVVELAVGAQFPEALLSRYLQDDARGFDLLLSSDERDVGLLSIFTSIKNEIVGGCISGAMFADGLSLALIAHVKARYAVRGEGLSSRGRLTQKHLARINEYVDCNLSLDISVACIAELVNMSPSHFSRVFKATTGMSPYRYLQDLRVRRSIELMKGPMSLAQIAMNVGLGSQSHFSDVFRRMTGVSPGKHRGQQRRREVAPFNEQSGVGAVREMSHF